MLFTIINYNYICVNQLLTCKRSLDIHIMANLLFFRFSICLFFLFIGQLSFMMMNIEIHKHVIRTIKREALMS